MIRVALVDDQTLVRQGLRSLLELAPDIDVVWEAAGCDEALSKVSTNGPDVLLLDMRMPGKSGLEVLHGMSDLRAAGTMPATLILTTFDDDTLVLQGVRAGARGYLLKDVSLETLTSAIRKLAKGESLIQPAVTNHVLQGLDNRPPRFEGLEPPDPLTAKETEVLRLMAGGYSNREIAEALGLSEGTVKNHVSVVLSKLGVRDRTRAVLKGLADGLIA